MERKKIEIKDAKRTEPFIIWEDHPFFLEVESSLMPDEYRLAENKVSNMSEDEIEERIEYYYDSLEEKIVFFELIVLGIMRD